MWTGAGAEGWWWAIWRQPLKPSAHILAWNLPLCVAEPWTLNLYTHTLLSGQSVGREQWTASGALWLSGRAVSMEEAVGCAATNILPLRSWRPHLPPPAWPRDRLQSNALLCPAVGPDPGCAGGLALPVWPVHFQQSAPITPKVLPPVPLCHSHLKAGVPDNCSPPKPLEPKPSPLAWPCPALGSVSCSSVCVYVYLLGASGREDAPNPPPVRNLPKSFIHGTLPDDLEALCFGIRLHSV